MDADILVYRSAFSCQKTNPVTKEVELEPEYVALGRANEMLETMLAETKATEYQLWLSDSTENGFRVKVYPEYKAGRPPKPIYYDVVKKYLIDKWGAQITKGQEADDILGIKQQKYPDAYNNCDCLKPFYSKQEECGCCYSSVICSIDKDLLQIPGYHFNFVKKEWRKVSDNEGLRFFYKQLLTGDTSDHLQGCPKVGDSKASKALEGIFTEWELFAGARRCYFDNYAKHIFKVDKLSDTQEAFVLDQILIQGICLRIRTREGEVWSFPE